LCRKPLEGKNVRLTKSVENKLHRPTFWHFVTLEPDGTPYVRPVWVDEKDGHVLVNSGARWRKVHNARANPHVALSMVELDNPYERVEIRGCAVEFIGGQAADLQLDQLAKRYLGLAVYPWRKSGEARVIIRIEPKVVVHHVDTDDPHVLPVA
jgi:PPOX class probable F420-dependent enzyme